MQGAARIKTRSATGGFCYEFPNTPPSNVIHPARTYEAQHSVKIWSNGEEVDIDDDEEEEGEEKYEAFSVVVCHCNRNLRFCPPLLALVADELRVKFDVLCDVSGFDSIRGTFTGAASPNEDQFVRMQGFLKHMATKHGACFRLSVDDVEMNVLCSCHSKFTYSKEEMEQAMVSAQRQGTVSGFNKRPLL